jgi:hypothetical protein
LDAKVPIVIYTYAIDGEFYSGEFEAAKLFSFVLIPRDPPVEEMYPQGTTLPIRYNPHDPALSMPVSRHSLSTIAMG